MATRRDGRRPSRPGVRQGRPRPLNLALDDAILTILWVTVLIGILFLAAASLWVAPGSSPRLASAAELIDDHPIQASGPEGASAPQFEPVSLPFDAPEPPAEDEMQRREPDLVVLDIGLPDISGIEVCRRIRRGSAVPIMFLTARQEEVDKVVGLDAGGDEYVVKPVGIAELAARVRALLRRSSRSNAPVPPSDLRIGAVFMDLNAHRVELNGQEVPLTPREFDLLRLLMSNAGRALSRQQILDSVWGTDWFGDENVVEVFVRQLRRKLEANPDRPVSIETVRGVGYRYAVPRD